MTELLIDAIPVPGDVVDAVPQLAAVPDAVLERWRRHGGVQQATVFVGRRDAAVVAAAFEVHRPHTAYRLILDVWTAGDSAGEATGDECWAVHDAIVAAVEQRAVRDGAVMVKRWFPRQDAAWHRSLALGYTEVPVPRWSGPVAGPDHRDPGYGQIRRLTVGPTRAVPYLRQTTDFTCGPAALLMALAALGLAGPPDRAEELRLWRSATTVGGCDPLGLAVAAADLGARPQVTLSTDQPILLELCDTDEERELRGFLQGEFRARAAEQGLQVRTETFDLEELRAALDTGAVVLVLIEQAPMHAESCPHWIAVHSAVGDIFYANDPWTDADLGETFLDGVDLPLPAATLDRLAWYGTPAYRSMLVVPPHPTTVSPTASTPR